jgi:hypothetical protein
MNYNHATATEAKFELEPLATDDNGPIYTARVWFIK